jgi:nucleoside 2-deoxyribosyltransferase
MLAFLCGGMENAPDGGRAWREQMGAWIQSTFNHRVYDPTQEAERILSEEELRGLANWKAADPERFRKVMRFIINHDLDVMARQADYVVCYWDEAAARGGGTQAELTAAYRKGIPVYMVSEIATEKTSGWVVGCADRIFSGFDALKAHLANVYGNQARQEGFWDSR